MKPKDYLFILRSNPLKDTDLQEIIDQILTFKAFEQRVSLFFLDRGVQLLDPNEAIQRPLLKGLLEVLVFYEVDQIMAEAESLEAHGLSIERLSIPVTVIERHAWSQVIESPDRQVLS